MKDRTPFWYLAAHFVRRMFSSEEEGSTGSISLGIGSVLAVLAAPGALACFFLLEKYAHPRILIGGHRFDAYKLSAPDEYFFIVLSMTIIGLIMVLRWNRLLPDRRDFLNLAALPISSRDVFLANFTALVALALLFAVVVNGVSCLLYPAIVTFADGSLSGYFRVAAAHSVAVFSAGLFSFFAVLALVGVLMLAIPQRFFRSVSVVVRVILVVALLTAIPSGPTAYWRLLPPAWFLGLYENMAGFATPAMSQLSHRAVLALLAAILVSIGSYSLCYQRHYLRLAESLDLIGSPRHRFHPPIPGFLFRSRLEHACLSFAFKTLLRSERHILFFGAYVGVGLVVVYGTNVLAIPLLLSFFLITGLRFAFDIPAVLNANWLFRSALEKPQPPLRYVARKFGLAITLPWQLIVLAPVMAHFYGWPLALAHTAVVAVLTIMLAELLFAKFRAIPFTCSVQPDTQRVMGRILGSVIAVLIIVPVLADIEHWMLLRAVRFIPAALLIAIVWFAFGREKSDAADLDHPLIFEDRPASTFELLKLA